MLIFVNIDEGAIESIGALSSMVHMKAYSCDSYMVGLGLTNFFIDLRVGGIWWIDTILHTYWIFYKTAVTLK